MHCVTTWSKPCAGGGRVLVRQRSIHPPVTRLLVTSASGANGDGYGAILGFTQQGVMEGPFSLDPRIVDPRGLCVDPAGELVYLNSGDGSRPGAGPARSRRPRFGS